MSESGLPPTADADKTHGDSTTKKPVWRQPKVVIPILIVLAGLAVVAGFLFQPWKLFIDNVVIEPEPSASEPAAGQNETEASSQTETLATGQFISHEHETSGTVEILQLSDGQQVLRLKDLDTSNGPDLKVWLSKGPVVEGQDGWYVFSDYDHVDLGPLKGNVGDQNYSIPAEVDPADFSSVVIWCDRFSVSFGAAELSQP